MRTDDEKNYMAEISSAEQERTEQRPCAEVLIVTGMSGAGKSAALHTLEDLGYYCVDNLPWELLPEIAGRLQGSAYKKLAFGADIRSGKGTFQPKAALKKLSEAGFVPRLLFMDCSESVLIRRYKSTRRIHPLQMQIFSDPDSGRSSGNQRAVQNGLSLEDALAQERELLSDLRKKVDYYLDTSDMTLWQSRHRLQLLFDAGDTAEKNSSMPVLIISFGYSKGMPTDCDLIFDVRFLPNPYYVPEMREATGQQKEVQDYVMQGDDGEVFMQKTLDLFRFLLPRYQMEGKSQLVIGIGCTGGQHRSVTIAELLTERLKQEDFRVSCFHRDI